MNRFAMAAGLVLSFTALAQSPETPSAASQRAADLARLQARVASLKAKLAESERKVATVEEEVKRLNLRLELAAEESRVLATRREELTERLAALGRDRERTAHAVARRRAELLARARVLQRFGRYGYFRVLLEARDVPAFFEGVERLDALARRDGRLLARHRAAESRLAEDLARERAVKREIDALYARSRREQVRVASLHAERERFLSRQRSFTESRRDEVATLTDKAARLERLLDVLARQSSGEVSGATGGIRPWKGVLDWPARGAIVETFGRHRHPRFDAWTVSNGVALALPAGTPVRAVYGGKVVYAQWLAEYGNLVILDHGEGIFTLYAWLQAVSVRAGSVVPVGEAVGVAGTGPGRTDAGLYFEIRDRQRASDPVAWLR
jgi:septal ring factor EnvC (AmiA/AmiB activator)